MTKEFEINDILSVLNTEISELETKKPKKSKNKKKENNNLKNIYLSYEDFKKTYRIKITDYYYLF